MKAKPPLRPELKQRLPEELTNDLLGLIRRQFLPDAPEKEWFKDHHHFIKLNVVLWPARFMVGKGFSIPADRYHAIMVGILNEIKCHGDTAKIRNWSRYLMTCVQEHWKHHWEEYYGEAKSLRNQAEAALLALKPQSVDDGARVIEAMAAAHRVLTGKKKPKKVVVVRQSELAI